MLAKKKPLGWLAQEAGDGQYTGQNTAFSCHCQVHSPIPWLIRSNFIESLISQRFTAKNSLRAEILERCGNGWN